eukprot:GILI01013189.1.p1 GENE.GILI01013189.1~~GILI01013189.1.p1  ORF type:complete len:224 (-),score=60.83 GILI01013189.1:105-776(-)
MWGLFSEFFFCSLAEVVRLSPASSRKGEEQRLIQRNKDKEEDVVESEIRSRWSFCASLAALSLLILCLLQAIIIFRTSEKEQLCDKPLFLWHVGSLYMAVPAVLLCLYHQTVDSTSKADSLASSLSKGIRILLLLASLPWAITGCVWTFSSDGSCNAQVPLLWQASLAYQVIFLVFFVAFAVFVVLLSPYRSRHAALASLSCICCEDMDDHGHPAYGRHADEH